jgi:uncharacterized protein
MTHTRLKERAEIAERLDIGESISMLAPRRIGKTWLMKKVAEDLYVKGWHVVSIDVEGLRSEKALLQALCTEIEKSVEVKDRLFLQIKQRFNQAMGAKEGQTLLDAAATLDPRQFLETLIEGLNSEPRNTVIMIDEIALFVLALAKQDPDEAHALLYHLRKLLQKYTKVRWFLTGSIGLDVVARRFDLQGAFLDYHTYPLQPFTIEEARSYAVSNEAQPIAGRRFGFDEGAFEYLAAEIGWLSPYYVKLVLDRLVADRRPDNKLMASQVNVEAAIASVLRPEFRTHFAGWQEHLRKNFLIDQTNRLVALLDALSHSPAGELEATLLAKLSPKNGPPIPQRQMKDDLLILQSDGFLESHEGRWRFRSGLLRRFWLEYVTA